MNHPTDLTYNSLCNTSCGTPNGMRNSSIMRKMAALTRSYISLLRLILKEIYIKCKPWNKQPVAVIVRYKFITIYFMWNIFWLVQDRTFCKFVPHKAFDQQLISRCVTITLRFTCFTYNSKYVNQFLTEDKFYYRISHQLCRLLYKFESLFALHWSLLHLNDLHFGLS